MKKHCAMRCFFIDTGAITNRVYVESFNSHTFERPCHIIFATFVKLRLTN